MWDTSIPGTWAAGGANYSVRITDYQGRGFVIEWRGTKAASILRQVQHLNVSEEGGAYSCLVADLGRAIAVGKTIGRLLG